jgi:type IV pilus assembly protein PilW
MAEANMDGTLAMQSLVRELRIAGTGLGPPDALRCDLTRAVGVTLGPVLSLQPLAIVDGAAGASDTIELLASGKPQSQPAARLLATYAQGSADLTVDSSFGVLPGDWLMLQQAGTPRCLLLQAQLIPVGAFRIEPAALPEDAVPAAGYAAGSALVNLGSLHRLRYAIGADASLQQARFDIATGHWSSNALAANIVNLQAQYGIDARPGVQPVPAVTWWSDVIIDADGNGSAGNVGDWQRVLAVRIAIVLRSAQRVEGVCDTVAPTWMAGDAVTGQLVPVTLSLGTAAKANCYRYRVIEAEVPLRNLLWSDA